MWIGLNSGTKWQNISTYISFYNKNGLCVKKTNKNHHTHIHTQSTEFGRVSRLYTLRMRWVMNSAHCKWVTLENPPTRPFQCVWLCFNVFGCFCWLINVPKKENLASLEDAYEMEKVSPGRKFSESESFKDEDKGSITSSGARALAMQNKDSRKNWERQRGALE